MKFKITNPFIRIRAYLQTQGGEGVFVNSRGSSMWRFLTQPAECEHKPCRIFNTVKCVCDSLGLSLARLEHAGVSTSTVRVYKGIGHTKPTKPSSVCYIFRTHKTGMFWG